MRISPKGLIFVPELSEPIVLEVSGFSVSKIGVNTEKNDEIIAAGFLIRTLKSNFELFLGALDRPGTESRKNPSKVIIATDLKISFLDMRASFQKQGAP